MEGGARITFNDPRRFGAMDLMPTAGAEAHKLLSVLGPEPLGNDFHEGYLVAAFRGRNTPVKSALLDQGIVAGLGNIYVCEALFRAGISPLRKAGRIAAPRVAALVPAIRDVLERPSRRRIVAQDRQRCELDIQHASMSTARGAPCHTPCDETIRRTVQSGARLLLSVLSKIT